MITIEPFLSTKSRVVNEAADGWTLVGARGNLSAQYEHTMIITKGEPHRGDAALTRLCRAS